MSIKQKFHQSRRVFHATWELRWLIAPISDRHRKVNPLPLQTRPPVSRFDHGRRDAGSSPSSFPSVLRKLSVMVWNLGVVFWLLFFFLDLNKRRNPHVEIPKYAADDAKQKPNQICFWYKERHLARWKLNSLPAADFDTPFILSRHVFRGGFVVEKRKRTRRFFLADDKRNLGCGDLRGNQTDSDLKLCDKTKKVSLGDQDIFSLNRNTSNLFILPF